MSMEKKIAIIIGCIVMYCLLRISIGPQLNILLLIALIAFGTYWTSRH